MLLLTRRREEEIIIGHDIIIKVLKIRADEVVIGITAPKSTTIHRAEVYQAILRKSKNSEDGSHEPTQL